MGKRKLVDALGDFQKRSVDAYFESWDGYWKFLADVARDPRSVPAAYGRLADVNVRSYKTALDASVALTQSLFGGAPNGTGTEPAPEAAPEPPATPVRELIFEGAAGETPSRQFVVANKTEQPLDVAFEISEFLCDDMRRVRVEVDVVPPAFSLQPGEEKVVECRIPISAALAGGCDQRAILRAVGLPEMQMVLTVRRTGAS